MNTLKRGARVEICPYPQGYSFGYLAEYDGCEARIVNLRGHGDRLEAKVEVIGSSRGGPLKEPVPVLALKRLEDG